MALNVLSFHSFTVRQVCSSGSRSTQTEQNCTRPGLFLSKDPGLNSPQTSIALCTLISTVRRNFRLQRFSAQSDSSAIKTFLKFSTWLRRSKFPKPGLKNISDVNWLRVSLTLGMRISLMRIQARWFPSSVMRSSSIVIPSSTRTTWKRSSILT